MVNPEAIYIHTIKMDSADNIYILCISIGVYIIYITYVTIINENEAINF